jgi:two-component system NtrC family sensor kinase
VLLALALAIQLLGLATIITYRLQLGGGINVVRELDSRLRVTPNTPEAQLQLRGMRQPVRLLEVNGQPADGLLPEQVNRLLLLNQGALNRFLVYDARGERRALALHAERPWLTIDFRWRAWEGLNWLVGLFYLVLGLFVWRKLPDDRAARALLLFSLLQASMSSLQNPGSVVGLWLWHGVALLFALHTAAALHLGLAFTGRASIPTWRWVQRGITVVCLLLGLAAAYTVHLMIAGAREAADLLRTVSQVHFGLTLLVTLIVVVLSYRTSRPPNPAGLRKRARLMLLTMLLTYLLPGIWPALRWQMESEPLVRGISIVHFLLLSLFPVIMGFGILRLQVFDVRVVIRQGLVYGALSLGATLAYVALLLVVFQSFGEQVQAPPMMAFGLLLVVLAVSALRSRLQRRIDRLVYRSRHIYADAVTRASDRLARARNLDEVRAAAREALVDSMRLTRVALALRDRGDPSRMRITPLAEAGALGWEQALSPLPGSIEPALEPALHRALDERSPASAFDRQALDPDGDEAAFWRRYGLELAAPLVGSEGQQRVQGLLLLGPRRDGSLLDAGDRQLLDTLASQLAMALENAGAFEEIQRLKDGLEEQVAARTSELTETLAQLNATQARLVESQTQATLGRVVAGVVHEINSPLGVIRSSTDTLDRMMDKLAPPEGISGRERRQIDLGREVLRTMDQGCQRITEVVASLQQFVSLDEAEYKTVDVRHGLESTLLLLAPRLEDRVQVQRDIPDRPALVRCYPSKLNQAFLKLLENAADALEQGGRIRVAVQIGPEAITVTIADDGPGIPAARQAELFEFGFQRKTGGRIGLRTGLAYCKQTVEEINGRLYLSSEEGRGTSVTLHLPAVGAAQS